MAGSSLIGQLRILLGLETANLEAGTRRAKSELRGVRSEVGFLKSSLESLGLVLGAGMFIEFAKGALEYAAALEVTSEKTGTTVEKLQIMERWATSAGVQMDAVTKALARLNFELGRAKAGDPAMLKKFADAGFSADDLRKINDAADLYVELSDRISKSGDSSEQAAKAQELLNRQYAETFPMLRQGRKGYEEASAAARENGVVTEEQARAAHHAEVAIKQLGLTLKVWFAAVLTTVIPMLRDVAGWLEAIVGKAMAAVSWLGKIHLPGGGGATLLDNVKGTLRGAANVIPGGQAIITGLQYWLGAHRQPSAAGAHHPAAAPAPDPDFDLSGGGGHGGGGGGHRRGGGGGGGRDGAADAEMRRKEALRLAYEMDREQLDQQADMLRAQQALTTDTTDRHELELKLIDVERNRNAREIQNNLDNTMADRTVSGEQKEEAKKRAAKALALNEQLRIMDKQAELMQEELDRADDYDKTEAAVFDAKRAKLEAEESLATTAKERRAIELELLALDQQEKREQLQRIIDARKADGSPLYDATKVEQARIALGSLSTSGESDKARIYRDNAGPLEEWLRSTRESTAKVREAIEADVVHSIEEANDALAQYSASWIKVGGTAGNILRELYSELMKLLLARVEGGGGGLFSKILGIGQQIAGAAGAGGSVGGISKGSSGIGTGDLKGFATGGSFRIGGMAGIDRNLLSINGEPAARVGRDEVVSITPANDRGGGAGVYNDMRGAFLTQDLFDYIQRGDRGAAFAGGALGSAGAISNLRRKGARALPTGGRR